MTRQEKISSLVEQICSMNYGDCITKAQIATIIEEAEDTQHFRDVANAAVRRCIDAGHMVECVRKVGYRVVRPDDYTKKSVRQIFAGARRIDHGVKILSNAPVKDMSLSGIETYNRVSDSVIRLKASITGAKVEINMLATSKQHPLAIAAQR